MSSTPDELLPSTSALAPGSPSTTRSDCGQNGRVEIPSTPTSDIDDTAADLSSSRAAVERRFHAAALRRNERHSHADGGRPAALCAHVLLLLLLFAAAAVPATARRLPNIYWNSTNPIFRIDNTEHVFQVQILDQVDIICPYLGGDQQFLMDEDEIEFSQIYFVSRRAYDRCELEADARLVGVCRTPHERSDISLVFRSFTPLPGGLEYRPGQSYYFICELICVFCCCCCFGGGGGRCTK